MQRTLTLHRWRSRYCISTAQAEVDFMLHAVWMFQKRPRDGCRSLVDVEAKSWLKGCCSNPWSTWKDADMGNEWDMLTLPLKKHLWWCLKWCSDMLHAREKVTGTFLEHKRFMKDMEIAHCRAGKCLAYTFVSELLGSHLETFSSFFDWFYVMDIEWEITSVVVKGLQIALFITLNPCQ